MLPLSRDGRTRNLIAVPRCSLIIRLSPDRLARRFQSFEFKPCPGVLAVKRENPVQIFLGASTIWSGRQPVITSLHVVTGASTLALSLVLALTARTIGWRATRRQPGALLASEVAV